MVARMSAIASFYVLPRAQVPGLVDAVAAEEEFEFLSAHAVELEDVFEWSGYVMVHLLSFLEDHGVDLMRSDLDSESEQINAGGTFTVLITSQHRPLLDRLEPALYPQGELSAHFEEMGYGFDEVADAAREGIALLRDQIAALGDDDVLVVTVG